MVQVSRSVIIHSGLMVILIAIDQSSKWWAVHQQSLVLLNHGISFGWLSTSSSTLTWQIILIGLLLIALTFGWKQEQHWFTTAILAGGWSNWLDRLLGGAVVDWLSIPGTGIRNNLADYWITLGVLGLVFSVTHSVWKKKRLTV